MAKFNITDRRRVTATGPIRTTDLPGITTHEGGPAYTRDIKSDLFLLGVANMVGEDTFYEKASDRDGRFAGLVRKVALEDLDWLIHFVRWLRNTANMRSASLVAAAEGIHVRTQAGLTGPGRQLVAAALQRADEPGEFVAYWQSRFGRKMPAPVKKGLADAVLRLYNERNALKYDTDGRAVRFADVIELAHPRTMLPWQNALFEHLLARRHQRAEPFRGDSLGHLPMIAARQAFNEIDPKTRPMLLGTEHLNDLLARAGLTWEALSSWVGGPMTAAAWEAVISQMGLMALARNLRNFDEAGISDAVAEQICARFADREQVARSRMFPYRWLAAFEHAPSLRWGHALDKALDASLSAIPELPGTTLVLIDTSSSMTQIPHSRRSKMTPAKAAAIFGVALARRNPGRTSLIGFADGTFEHQMVRGAGLVQEVTAFMNRTGEVGHGTQIGRSVATRYRDHDRVFIISDMQTMADITSWHLSGRGGLAARDATATVPDHVPVYGINLGGYATTVVPAGQVRRRYEFGGLTDAMFSMIPLLEKGHSQGWPWEQ